MAQHVAARPGVAYREEAQPRVERHYVHDRTSWGAIWGGLLTTVSIYILLTSLALAIGLSVSGPSGPSGTLAGAASAAIGLIAFFCGGWLTGRTGAFVNASTAALNGFLMWALSVVILLLFAGLGIGTFFGAAVGVNTGAVTFSNFSLIASLRASSWVVFSSMAVALIVAVLSAWLGLSMRPAVDDGETDGD